MVTGGRRVVQAAWPVALLMLFVLVFNGQASRPQHPESAAECVTASTTDIAVLERCLTVQPDDIELMIDLAHRYSSSGRWTDAVRVYRRAQTVDPDDGDVHVLLGQALLKLDDVEGARREGEAAVAVQPGNPAALHLAGLETSRSKP
jgi:cytochrome c-type biogenesis protein CcmH/NrfG